MIILTASLTVARADIAITGADTASTPIVLNQTDSTYTLSFDFTATGTAFEIMADGITLDLGGNTVWFDTSGDGGSAVAGSSDECDGSGVSSGLPVGDCAGVWVASGADDVTIINGTISQYPNGGKYASGITFRSDNLRAAVIGCNINMSSWNNTMGIYARYARPTCNFRDNNITLSDTCVTVRERLHAAIKLDNMATYAGEGDGYIEYNTIRGGAQSGIEVYGNNGTGSNPGWAGAHTDTLYIIGNDIAMRTNTTNGNAIHMTRPVNAVIDSNVIDTVTGGADGRSGGGISIESGASDDDPGTKVIVRNNTVDVKQWMSPEYASSVFAYALKTEYASHVHFYNNDVRGVGFHDDNTKYKGHGIGLGLSLSSVTNDVWAWNNTIEGDNIGGASAAASYSTDYATAVHFIYSNADWDTNNIKIWDNNIKSNDLFIRVFYDYSVNNGIPWVLESCTFERTSNVISAKDANSDGIQDYTVYIDTPTTRNPFSGCQIIDPLYAGPTPYPDLSDADYHNSPVSSDYGIYWTTSIETAASASVWGVDTNSDTQDSSTADGSGDADLILPEWIRDSSSGYDDKNNYTVFAASGGDTVSSAAFVDQAQTIQLLLGESPPLITAPSNLTATKVE